MFWLKVSVSVSVKLKLSLQERMNEVIITFSLKVVAMLLGQQRHTYA